MTYAQVNFILEYTEILKTSNNNCYS